MENTFNRASEGTQSINLKHQITKLKWFGQLTILNQVEGQITNSNDSNNPLTFTLSNCQH
jgi:translation elongation factor EF-1alpha